MGKRLLKRHPRQVVRGKEGRRTGASRHDVDPKEFWFCCAQRGES